MFVDVSWLVDTLFSVRVRVCVCEREGYTHVKVPWVHPDVVTKGV